MPEEVKVSTPGDREVQVTREFDAPPDLVFLAYTRPELVRRWLVGPPGWSIVACEIDLRVGGRYRYEWKLEGGGSMAMSGVFREVTPPSRLQSREIFDEDWTGGETEVRVEFDPIGGQRTRLTQTMLYTSTEARDGALATGMTEGMTITYNSLEALLAELSAQSSSR